MKKEEGFVSNWNDKTVLLYSKDFCYDPVSIYGMCVQFFYYPFVLY